MRRITVAASGTLFLLAALGTARGQTAQKYSLTLDGAKKVIVVAMAENKKAPGGASEKGVAI
jgi:hypothetical protein